MAELIRLLGALGVDAPSVRSSVSRLKRRGLLVPGRTAQGAAGYALSGEARELLDDGDRRIYLRPAPTLGDGWVLAVFSVPEAERNKRHLLRSRLGGLGFGTAAPGVWIAPGRFYEETRHTLRRLGLDPYVDLFTGSHRGFAPTAEAVTRWWDLRRSPGSTRSSWPGTNRCCGPGRSAIRCRPRTPTATICGRWTPGGISRTRTRASPAELLPDDWPGARSADVFFALHGRLREAGLAFVQLKDGLSEG